MVTNDLPQPGGRERSAEFARYADAYRAALELTTAEHIKRNGKIARRA